MTSLALKQCAAFLAHARLGGKSTAQPEAALQPKDLGEAYETQALLHEELAGAGLGRTVGHRIGCTTPVMQDFLKINHPCAGEVFETTIYRGEASLAHSRFHRIGVECEIAARLGEDLPDLGRPHDRVSVAHAVSTLMAAIELVDDRYEDFTSLSAPLLIADDFFNAGVVLGAPLADWQALDLTNVKGRLLIDGHEIGRGQGADILGHPLEALAWLANHRIALGKPLRAGEFVMLGSVVKTHFFDRPGEALVQFPALGEARVRFT